MMSATVCNVLEVVLRTPGESINATAKIRRIVLTLSGDLNVRLLRDIQSKREDTSGPGFSRCSTLSATPSAVSAN
jgi:hypothetical protein